ncbi:hypothetical protein EDB92DRAFT_1400769 [Lactarius akahatsu]|uniref:Fungal-type protein kinase domain-containing protein n=1 Tax=Lactarius akahatsu TaxID=416441 RepID=A0AAD4QG98_9AGAM|nr:hypothetical protein EDB92DRAFT_1400769 [Lactarius akahatsu]
MSSLVPILGQNVNLDVCRGFIIDGDHAIEWRKGATASSLERSGTLPFMSTRLLDAWDLGEPALHTAVDDLESFLWVLIWSLVYIFKKFATMTNLDSIIHRLGHALSSRKFLEIIRKESIADRWTDKVFGDLIRDWLRIPVTSRTDVRELQETSLGLVNDGDTSDAQKRIFDELDERCGKAYKEFIHNQDITIFKPLGGFLTGEMLWIVTASC